MWLSFALIILVATLFIIFAETFVSIFKNYLSKPWFKLLIPLLFASYIFLEFQLFLVWVFNQFELMLFKTADFLTSFYPYVTWVKVGIHAIVISILTMLPILVVDQWIIYWHKTKRLNHRFYIAMLIWLFLTALYVSGIQF